MFRKKIGESRVQPGRIRTRRCPVSRPFGPRKFRGRRLARSDASVSGSTHPLIYHHRTTLNAMTVTGDTSSLLRVGSAPTSQHGVSTPSNSRPILRTPMIDARSYSARRSSTRLMRLACCRAMGLITYLKPALPARSDACRDKASGRVLSRTGRRLKGFCRTNLFKRLESSAHAFLLSVHRHVLGERNFHLRGGELEAHSDGPEDAALLDSRVQDQGDGESIWRATRRKCRRSTNGIGRTIGGGSAHLQTSLQHPDAPLPLAARRRFQENIRVGPREGCAKPSGSAHGDR